MRAKLNRGPMKGKIVDVQDGEWAVRIAEPVKLAAKWWEDTDTLVPASRLGEYHRSHRRMANGTIIFEWMGWLDGKV